MDSKLCPRNTTRFKRSSPRDSTNLAAAKTMITSLAMREDTMFKKAYELSTLCDIEVCVLYYGRDGELIKTWPEDKAKVRDMAERFSKLSDREKRKKSTNLSEFLAKKMSDEKKHDANKFSEKVFEMEGSLESRLPILQDKLRRLLSPHDHEDQTEPDQSLRVLSDCGGASRTEQNQILEVVSSAGFFSTDLSSSLIEDPQPLMNLPSISLIDDPHQQQRTEPITNFLSDLPSLNHHNDQSKFSIFLYNHDNGNFTQLPSSFDQSLTPALLGAQGFGGCNNNIHLPPPLMQTQNPLPQFGQFASWNQTPTSFGDPMMMFSSYN